MNEIDILFNQSDKWWPIRWVLITS